MNFYFLIFVSTVCFLIGDYFAKFWVANEKWKLFTITILFYLIASTFFLFALKKNDSLVISNSITTLTIFVGSGALGIFYFHEKLTTFQFTGIFLALAAIFLLTFPFQILQK